jgi:hypothetical protein
LAVDKGGEGRAVRPKQEESALVSRNGKRDLLFQKDLFSAVSVKTYDIKCHLSTGILIQITTLFHHAQESIIEPCQMDPGNNGKSTCAILLFSTEFRKYLRN